MKCVEIYSLVIYVTERHSIVNVNLFKWAVFFESHFYEQ